MLPGSKASDAAPVQALSYCTPATTRDQATQRTAKRISRVKRTAAVVAILILCLIGIVKGLIWWDWRSDHLVREWINGPHSDPVTSLRIHGGTPTGVMDVTVTDVPALLAINHALQTPSLQSGVSDGRSVEIELRLQSGKVVSTIGQVSFHSITWFPPEGDLYGGWDNVTIQVNNQSPKTLLDALSFVDHSTGVRKF
jgi:hypothetical protein